MKKFIAIITVMANLILYITPTVSALPDDIEIIKVVQPDPSKGGYVEEIYTDEQGNIIERDTHLSFEPTFDTMSDGATIPSSYDSRSKDVVTSVKWQGKAGNCWAFSAISALESSLISDGLAELGTTDFSESHLAWFGNNSATTDTTDLAYGDGITVANPYETGGHWKKVTQALSRWAGIANQDANPADYNDLSRLPKYTDAQRRNTNSGYVIKSAEELLTAEKVKSRIMEHGAVTGSYFHNDSYYYKNSTAATYYCDTETTTNHAITVIGWDDNFSKDNFNPDLKPTENGAWLCKNSWDTWWGDSGYFWISYYDATVCDFIAYKAQPFDDYYNNYNYNGSNAFSWMSYGTSSKIANVFTAKGYEKIKSVATYTFEENVTLTFEVYTDVNMANNNPTQGTLSSTYTVTIENSGYHVFDLPTPVSVAPGSTFTVVILTNGAKVGVETGEGYAAKTGTSYVYFSRKWSSNESFYDGEYDLKNYYIHALTVCDHQSEQTVTEATCTQDGYKKTTCKQCGETLSEEILPAGEHSFSEWKIMSAPTVEKSGLKTRSCSNCSVTETEEMPAMALNITDGIAIDYSSDMISGIKAGLTSLEEYIALTENYTWSYDTTNNRLGTGSKAVIKNGNTVVDQFTILLYGDVNGDSWYDGQDAVFVSCLTNGMLTRDNVGDAVYMAADCNHDGAIDESDIALLNEAGTLLANVDQSKSADVLLETSAEYVEYIYLIDQSPEIDVEDDTDTPEVDVDTTPEQDTKVDLFEMIMNFIKSIFEMLFAYIPVPYK